MLILSLSALIVLAVDQSSKKLVSGRLITIFNWIKIMDVTIAQLKPQPFRKRIMPLILFVLIFIYMLLLVQDGHFFNNSRAHMALGAAIGGAAGNLIDRLREKSVTDFIDVGFWPVFNVADVAIVMGIILAFWFI